MTHMLLIHCMGRLHGLDVPSVVAISHVDVSNIELGTIGSFHTLTDKGTSLHGFDHLEDLIVCEKAILR